jgi:hypothetical protein
MNDDLRSEGEALPRPSTGTPHPFVYKALIGFALWFVLAAWGFGMRRGYIALALAVVTWLVGVAVALPSIFARFRRRDYRQARVTSSLRNWLRDDFEPATGRTRASLAMLEIFVPVAAAAIGLTLFAIVKDVVT